MRDVVDEAVSCGALESETPGDRWEREQFERAIARKESVLEALGPLGFEDNSDAECPGAIWHKGASIVLDAATLSPEQVVQAVLAEGMARGRAEVRSQMRAALGL